MSEPTADARGPIAFAEKVLELLDQARFTATYKFAVLIGLIDLCLEQTSRTGSPPTVITTRQLAEKVVEVYWPHTLPFVHPSGSVVFRQNVKGQAEILSAIVIFRSRHAPDDSTPLWQARRAAPELFEKLVREIEWKLIEMPLPRLQVSGAQAEPFIYEIGWNQSIRRDVVARYQRGDAAAFDKRIRLRPQVGEYLLLLNGLLRPLIHKKWATMVAQLNGLEESRLEGFLFGEDRTATVAVRGSLWEIQAKQCFYCEARITDPSRGQVDHFIPWARYPDNGIENFVVADDRCNRDKYSFLAATEHVVRWAERFQAQGPLASRLAEVAARMSWDQHPGRTLSVARAIYLRLPEDAHLWLRGKEFVAADRAVLIRALEVA